ncbi:S41 family peptidase [Draconibacterium halophilum]|uniref:Tricorn protease homolog n=1 Tax=Draconibacterium halophilum TaxID=2706887 RepID=A0A6C0RD52_9BACT|nr:S41 family peptidase [Draconibacterium halophilum]QIA07997.1 protease [Draconibacterium halophilum]
MKKLALLIMFLAIGFLSFSQETRLLRQPTISDSQVAFAYGGDIWVSDLATNLTTRLTSTGAVESQPCFSPDGKIIAFNSNRSGVSSVYTVPVEGGTPTRITWHPSGATVRGWSPDGEKVLYASARETAPSSFARLWTISKNGGPASLLTKQFGNDGSFSPDAKKIVIDRVSRWDVEWRGYRGGQNKPLVILNLEDFSEEFIPNEKTTDIQPLWLGDKIYFISDRDFVANIWSYTPATKQLEQLTKFAGSDVKWLDGKDNRLVFEREGYLHLMNINTKAIKKLSINVIGDFPWAETKWEDVSSSARSASLSPTGKRAIFEARGEIFTVPEEHGDTRNITQSSNVADRAPIWSPKGDQLAWFSDKGGKGYALLIANQNGLEEPKSISIGESKLGWEPTWSPDGKYIAFTDDDVRIRVVNLDEETIETIAIGGNNMERGDMGLTWSPDSKWLAYTKSASNNFRQITIWSLEDKTTHKVTNTFADAFSPAWDKDKNHFYFLASTDLALGSGWANTSSMTANANYSAYVVNLQKNSESPFKLKSDEEEIKEDDDKESAKEEDEKDEKDDAEAEEKDESMKIDFENITERTIPLPIPNRKYRKIVTGAEGNIFIAESVPNQPGFTIQKFILEDREAKEFVSAARSMTISNDGKKMLAKIGSSWKIMSTSGASGKDGKSLKVSLKTKLDRSKEWTQIFEEAWRYERDYFYDPNLHGRDWEVVHERYAPLIPFVKHRADLTYILDQMNGELSVGHSFVMGGDYPDTESNLVGMLGADLVPENEAWKIERIYSTESWNPQLSSPLEEPGLKVTEGNFIVGVNGEEMTATDNPFKFLDGTSGVQTVLHINDKPDFESAWTITVKPIRSENALRQRAWVEDNRRKVDELSDGKLAYIWVPNTGSPGFISFNRYYFAQQNKLGAVIDERFNGGGLLDDYMVDLMTRNLRAGLTNEVPNGKPFRLPAGILGPKALLINEKAGSGGDFFPWVFRQQKAGPLIGSTTWGGLVKSSVHYSLVDGGALTAPDNAVFDPINNEWIAENKGVAPDIEVQQDTKSLEEGKDPQLERAVQEVLKLVQGQGIKEITPPPFPTPAVKK